MERLMLALAKELVAVVSIATVSVMGRGAIADVISMCHGSPFAATTALIALCSCPDNPNVLVLLLLLRLLPVVYWGVGFDVIVRRIGIMTIVDRPFVGLVVGEVVDFVMLFVIMLIYPRAYLRLLLLLMELGIGCLY